MNSVDLQADRDHIHEPLITKEDSWIEEFFAFMNRNKYAQYGTVAFFIVLIIFGIIILSIFTPKLEDNAGWMVGGGVSLILGLGGLILLYVLSRPV